MTKEQEDRVIEFYGPDYKDIDVPTYIRLEDACNEEHDNCIRLDN